MELQAIWKLLRRWWWLMVMLAAVGGMVAYLITPEPIPLYEATTTVLLSQSSEELPNTDAIRTAQQVADTYAQLLKTRPLMEDVIQNLELSMSPETVANKINVEQEPGTNLMRVSVTDTDPDRAALIANEVVRLFVLENVIRQSSRYENSRQELTQELDSLQVEIEELQLQVLNYELDMEDVQSRIDQLNELELEGPLTSGQRQEKDNLQDQYAELFIERNKLQSQLTQKQTRYQTLLQSYEDIRLLAAQSSGVMTVVEEALPGRSVTPPPRKQVNAAQGALAGAVLGFGAAFLLEMLRVSSVENSEDIERITGLPTVGVISDIKGTDPPEKLVTARQPRSATAEAYRVLRSNIEFASDDQAFKTIVITSSSPVEGKTTTSANLAAAVAQTGKRVILVDTDLRRPTLHKYFEQTNTRGVTTALLRLGDSGVTEHVVPTGIDNLYLMPSGPLPPNPADLLGSPRMLDLIQELQDSADMVVFDSPPTLVVADASLLARRVDATLVVALAQSTRQDTLKKAVEQIQQSGANLLGVVLNRVSGSGNGYYYYNSYYYTSEE